MFDAQQLSILHKFLPASREMLRRSRLERIVGLNAAR
jgi:hypothetical protein